MNRQHSQMVPPADPSPDRITTLGDGSQTGSYLLRLNVSDSISVAFGRFQGGSPVTIPAGTYLYVGSAMNGLANRLLRHAARSGDQPPHEIYFDMLDSFPRIGLTQHRLKPLREKRLHWHIDYLLEREEVSLAHVYLLRCTERLESSLVHFLEQDTHTFIVGKGLGASDSPGSTHFLGVSSDKLWWQKLANRLESRFF